MVFQVDRNSYRSQTKSLCDLIDLDVPVCAAPSDVDQTRYPNVTSFFPLGWVQHPKVLRHSDRTYKWCMTSVILASADEQLLAVLMGLSPPPGTPPAALSLRKYHYPRCLSSRIHREQSDGRARTLDTIRRLELVTQSLACEGNSGNVSAEGVFGCQGTGHCCFFVSVLRSGSDEDSRPVYYTTPGISCQEVSRNIFIFFLRVNILTV